MDAKERYFWDLTGYLVVKNVLAKEDLEIANAAIDYCADRINQDEDNKSVGDSTFLRGTGSRWMHGTNLLNIDPPYCQPFRQMLHGSGDPHKPYVAYHHQNRGCFTVQG